MQQKTREPARGTSLTILIRIHCIFSILTALWTPWTTGSHTGRLPKPIMEVEPRIVSWTQSATVRCSAQKGDRCHFYTNESHVPFKTVQFKSTFGLCRAQVMWNEVAMSSHNVVLVSCAVEVNVELSPRSDGQIFQVIGVTLPRSHPLPDSPSVGVAQRDSPPWSGAAHLRGPIFCPWRGPLLSLLCYDPGGQRGRLGGAGGAGLQLARVQAECDWSYATWPGPLEPVGPQGGGAGALRPPGECGGTGDALPAGVIAGTLIPILITACLLGLYLTYRKTTRAKPRSEEGRRTESDREHQESLYVNVAWAQRQHQMEAAAVNKPMVRVLDATKQCQPTHLVTSSGN